eukprot:1393705-Amorphochlora_amoeboformis.AAC.1
MAGGKFIRPTGRKEQEEYRVKVLFVCSGIGRKQEKVKPLIIIRMIIITTTSAFSFSTAKIHECTSSGKSQTTHQNQNHNDYKHILILDRQNSRVYITHPYTLTTTLLLQWTTTTFCNLTSQIWHPRIKVLDTVS